MDTADRIQDVGRLVITPVQQAARFIPGVNLMTSTPEERAERARENEIRRAAAKAQKEERIYLPTNR